MYSRFYRAMWVMVLVCGAMLLGGQAIAADMKATGKQPETTLNLSVSKDGRSIVDQDGKEVARFKEGMHVAPAKAGEKMQGCMRCTYDCVVYEGERCVKKIRSCTWDFDCK